MDQPPLCGSKPLFEIFVFDFKLLQSLGLVE